MRAGELAVFYRKCKRGGGWGDFGGGGAIQGGRCPAKFGQRKAKIYCQGQSGGKMSRWCGTACVPRRRETRRLGKGKMA